MQAQIAALNERLTALSYELNQLVDDLRGSESRLLSAQAKTLDKVLEAVERHLTAQRERAAQARAESTGFVDGTVSFGSYRDEDLAPKCMAELARLAPITANALAQIFEREQYPLQAQVEVLFVHLDSIASDYGCTFSAHPGDGCDFGFWTVEG